MVDSSTSMITQFQLAPVPFFIPMGSLLVPEMQRRGYSSRMSLGPILGTGGLAMIIPPSTLGVLLASLAGIDVERTPLADKLRSVAVNVLPMTLVVCMVIGLIIFGIATPTESAAFGVLGVLVLVVAYRKLSIDVIRKSMVSTIRVGGMVFFIILNSSIFSQLLANSGASSGMLNFATSFEVANVVLLLFMLSALEMSQTTPPFGLLLFVMLGVAPPGTTLRQVAGAAAAFLACDAILLVLLLTFPATVQHLPGPM